MAGIGDTLGKFVPSVSGDSVMTVLMWVFFGIVIMISAGIIGWKIIDNKRFNKFVCLYRSINGKMEWIATHKVCFERIGIAGDYWAKAKNGKIFQKPRWEIKKNTYLMFEREDGEWINWTPTNLDKLMKEAGI